MTHDDTPDDLCVQSAAAAQPVADNIWIVDDWFSPVGKLEVPIRMTVIRLSSGDLLLHSPTPYSESLHRSLAKLGNIRYLLAPSVAHWMYVPEWQRALPQAETFAVPGLAARRQARKAGLRVDHEILHDTPAAWREELETVLVSASVYSELAVFHRPSGTLVLTDLVQNFQPATLPQGVRQAATLLGVTAPDGRAPLYLRALVRLGGRGPRLAASRLVAMAPERVIFAHGEWFQVEGRERLSQSLKWLTGADAVTDQRPGALAGVRVVITGASSGIGRATALSFARGGATVVLAARREGALKTLALECEALGGRALVVATDVTDAEAVANLARQADTAFGGIDVWINNAGTGVIGAFAEAGMALHRRTIEVNLLGTMHGAHAVLPIFTRQRRGVLINNISMGGWSPTPFAAAYTASKFGLRGFTASIRQELAAIPGIKVCAVFPSLTDTPGLEHTANQLGRNIDPGPFLYQPEDVAATFVALVQRPRAEVAVGWPARAAQLAYAAAPAFTEKASGAIFRYLISRARSAPRTHGSLLDAEGPGISGSGGWLARKGLLPAGQITQIALFAGLMTATAMAFGRARRTRRQRRS